MLKFWWVGWIAALHSTTCLSQSSSGTKSCYCFYDGPSIQGDLDA